MLGSYSSKLGPNANKGSSTDISAYTMACDRDSFLNLKAATAQLNYR